MNSAMSVRQHMRGGARVTVIDQLGQWIVGHWGWGVLLAMGLASFNVLFRLGEVPVNDMDEARYGVSAWEMLNSGNFLVTTYGGQPEYWNLKPPLGYWLLAGSFKLLGPTTVALRLPSALAALATVLVILLRGQHLIGRRAALLAALMFATGFGFLAHHGARSGDLDALLTLLLTLAAFELPLMKQSGAAVLRFGLWFGLGFLLKSFAVLPLLVVGVAYLMLSGDWRQLPRPAVLVAGLLAIVPTMIWAVLRWQADGSAYFLQRMVREDLVDRSLTRVDNVQSHPWSYATAIFDRFAPWPLLVVVAVTMLSWWCYRQRAVPLLQVSRQHLLWLGLWAVLPLVMFSIARTHHHWYMNPVYPAWAMLAALAALQFLRCAAASSGKQMMLLTVCVLLPLLANEARLLHRIHRDISEAAHLNKLDYLAKHRDVLGARVAIGSIPHSERFVLQVMNGYEVDESDNCDLNLPVWQAFRTGAYDTSISVAASIMGMPGR